MSTTTAAGEYGGHRPGSAYFRLERPLPACRATSPSSLPTGRSPGSAAGGRPIHGQWIAFTRNTRRVSALKDPDIFIMRRNGSRLRRLTYRGGAMSVWSPDGRQIAFLRDGLPLYGEPTAPNASQARPLRQQGELPLARDLARLASSPTLTAGALADGRASGPCWRFLLLEGSTLRACAGCSALRESWAMLRRGHRAGPQQADVVPLNA